MTVTVTPAARVRRVVRWVRTGTTLLSMTLLAGFGVANMVASPQSPGAATQLGMSSGPLDALMQANRCSFTGFDRNVVPSKAIVRTPEGATELVSFDRGWAVFNGEIAGEFVAVCLGPKRPTVG